MPVVAFVDYVPPKRIYLSAETVNAELDTMDVYREVRALRRTTEAHRQFPPMIVAGGNVQKTVTTFTTPYVQLLYGCRIVPFDTSHLLTLTRETFTDDNLSGAQVFDRTPLSPAVEVDISVDVQQVELRLVPTGSAVLPSDITAIRDAVWAQVIETGYSAEQILRVLAAVNGGRTEKDGTTIRIRSIDNPAVTRIEATVVDGLRTSVTVTP